MKTKEYGEIILIEKLPTVKNKDRKGKFKCFCGNEFITQIRSVTRKMTKSCGCLMNKWCDKTKRIKDGRTKTRLYKIFIGMINRCHNPNNRSYFRYGATGITVCEEWKDFTKFKKWAEENGYDDELTLDRKKGDDGYSPDNCRWATPQQQSRNTRKNKKAFSKYKGVSYRSELLKPWVAEITVNYKRIRLGTFATQEEAALAYNEKAEELFGEFACLNIIDFE